MGVADAGEARLWRAEEEMRKSYTSIDATCK